MTEQPNPMAHQRPDFTKTVTLTMNRAEAKSLARMIRWRLRKSERNLAKSTFVPEPGRRNAAEVSMERMFDLLARFEDALGMDIQVWEDEVFDDE